MKNVKNWLVFFLSTGLTSCALSMGHDMCKSDAIPSRPEQSFCISNGSGTASCYDPREFPSHFARPIKNYVCYDPNENQAHEEWIQQVLDACRGN